MLTRVCSAPGPTRVHCGSAEHEWPLRATTGWHAGAATAKEVSCHVAAREQKEEEHTTDAESCMSDAESISSVCPTSASNTDSELSECSLGRFDRWKPMRLQSRRFQGTKLEPIPGTPCAVQVGQSAALMSAHAEGSESAIKPHTFIGQCVPAVIPPPPMEMPALPGTLRTLPSVPMRDACGREGDACEAPASPKRHAREAMLARARSERLPLKVRVPEGAPEPRADLDPALPAKKRLTFGDLASLTAAVAKRLQQGEPAKKRPSGFLLKEPPCVLWTPGLPTLPR